MPFFVSGHPTLPGFVFDPPYDTRQYEALPATARQADERKLADIMLDTGDLNIVSGRFRTIVEELEPGVHLFHPLAVSSKSGAPCGEDYYVFRCGQGIGAVLSLKSRFDGTWSKTVQGKPYRGLATGRTDGLYLSAPEIAGKHLFGNLFHGPVMLVFSDELIARLKPLDLRYLVTHPVVAVDEPWDVETEIGPWLDWVGTHRAWIREQQPATAEETIALYERYHARPKG
jgi:uncharacterized protein DUF1629